MSSERLQKGSARTAGHPAVRLILLPELLLGQQGGVRGLFAVEVGGDFAPGLGVPLQQGVGDAIGGEPGVGAVQEF